MKIKGKITWEDLPKPINAFTVRHASMLNLNTGEIVQYYSANTKIAVVQKAVTEFGTFYRTFSAEHHSLNWAFEASALGLPNEKAPSAPSRQNSSLSKSTTSRKPSKPTSSLVQKQKTTPKASTPNDGEGGRHYNWVKKIFRRKNG